MPTGDEVKLPVVALEMFLHDFLRELESTWHSEEDGRPPPASSESWEEERNRLRREARQVALYGLTAEAVTPEEVAEIARQLQGQGILDPFVVELQGPSLGAIAAGFRKGLLDEG